MSSAAAVRILGTLTLPMPHTVNSKGLGESSEGLLVRASGTITRLTHATSGTATIVMSDGEGSLTVSCWQACAPTASRGSSVEITGIAGQRWSRSGAADGYRIWPREAADVRVLGSGGAGNEDDAAASTAPGSSAAPSGVVTIASARSRAGVDVTIEAAVTTVPGFIDTDARRVVVQDASGGLLVRLLADGPTVAVGDRLRIVGRIGTFGGAPQLAATKVTATGHGSAPAPRALAGAPASADEWRLVRVDGRVQAVRRYGSTWRAEIRLVAGATVCIQGTTRSGVPSTALVEGRDASIVGVVRRPSSGATDQRLAVLPRSAADVALGPAAGAGSSAGGASSGTGTGGSDATAGGGSTAGGARDAGLQGGAGAAIDADLSDLASHVGELVRVGGTVSATRIDGLTLDDGTGQAAVRVVGEAATLLPSIEPGDVLNVVGRVERAGDAPPVVVTSDPEAVARVGSLGESIPLAAGPTAEGSGVPGAAGDGSESEIRPLHEIRLGAVALPLPDGMPGWTLVLIVGVLLAGSIVTAFVGHRVVVERRERTGRSLVNRLAHVLAAPSRDVQG